MVRQWSKSPASLLHANGQSVTAIDDDFARAGAAGLTLTRRENGPPNPGSPREPKHRQPVDLLI